MTVRPRDEESFATASALKAAIERIEVSAVLRAVPGMQEAAQEAARAYDQNWLRWVATASEEEIVGFCARYPLV